MRILAVITTLALFVGPAVACPNEQVEPFDTFKDAVERCATDDGFVLVNPEALPAQFERGLTPAETYTEDEFERLEYERFSEEQNDDRG